MTTETQAVPHHHLFIPEKNDDDATVLCDRRLSRAARKLLKLRLQNFVVPNETTIDDISVDALLERWVASIPSSATSQVDTRSKNCPLLPHKDIYQHEEDQTQHVHIQSLSGSGRRNLKVAFPQILLMHMHETDGSKNADYTFPSEIWFKCGICGKIFVSQYYLDLHMNKQHSNHHAQTHQQTRTTTMICPANEWCQLVGLANCHHQALQDEPYYDRGGSEDATISHRVQHKWSKMAHAIPCDAAQLQTSCQTLMATCGFLPSERDASNPDNPNRVEKPHGETFAERFCRSLTCPPQQTLWQFLEDETYELFLGSSSSAAHLTSADLFHAHWESHWETEIDHHSTLLSSWKGFLVTALLMLLLLRKTVMVAREKWALPKRISIPAGQRILHKRGSAVRTSRHKRD